MSARALNQHRVETAFVPQIFSANRRIGSIKIESGIPICDPATIGRPKGEVRLAIEALSVGQSFQIPKAQVTSGHIKALAKRIGIKVVCRLVSKTHRRIWRTA